jgi:hypothetical protein
MLVPSLTFCFPDGFSLNGLLSSLLVSKLVDVLHTWNDWASPQWV